MSSIKRCSHQNKDVCKTSDGCVWIINKGCRVHDNVPLAVLATNKKKEALIVKIVAKAKQVSDSKPKAKNNKPVSKKNK
jgi:hypothetical protein